MELIMIELPIALYETQYVRYQHAIGKSFQSTEKQNTYQESGAGDKGCKDAADEKSACIVTALEE